MVFDDDGVGHIFKWRSELIREVEHVLTVS
jgi:hypothetical protein